ncbi:DUF2306 domain-containing protein [Thalassotalea sp. SU-HH00458]|uniref:DUF2306 domain-containing protein n=1 Tax=Thalassotalea sp. SU-HH00458 TaxID=3127657 RepID=UPI003109DF1D
MTNSVLMSTETVSINANKWLTNSVKAWFITAVLGQWLFAAYVGLFYGGATLNGDISQWNEVMPHGYVEGDFVGNLAVGVHLLLAFIVLVAGPLQFIGQIRNNAPAFHRLLGRIYIFTAFILSIGGLYMVWTRGTVGAEIGKYSISINAILIMIFASLAVYNAIKRNIKVHRRWAIRLFLVMGGVWFFRISLMLWLMIHQAPVGFDPKTFTGPFLTFLGFAQYGVPLAFAQLYFYAQDSKSTVLKTITAIVVLLLTLATIGGILSATMGMWLPRF